MNKKQGIIVIVTLIVAMFIGGCNAYESEELWEMVQEYPSNFPKTGGGYYTIAESFGIMTSYYINQGGSIVIDGWYDEKLKDGRYEVSFCYTDNQYRCCKFRVDPKTGEVAAINTEAMQIMGMV